MITWLFGVGCPNAKDDVASSVEHGGLLMCVEDESHLSDGRVDGELVKNKKEHGRGKRQTVIPFVFKKINGN